jgi:SAM-dependent methyltransferase
MKQASGMDFSNSYGDSRRANAYDELGWGGTYQLVYRALTRLLQKVSPGPRALDFGCGTGRSTRLLKNLGYQAIGIDISEEMLARARARDTGGDYRKVDDGDFSPLKNERFDLILSAFTFDNIPTREHRILLLSRLRSLLLPAGVFVNIVSTEDMYRNEWVTFTTEEFPGNRTAKCGDVVRIITRDCEDNRPVEDILWPHRDYLDLFDESELDLICCEAPLAQGDEGIAWRSEISIPPWRIYLLRARESRRCSEPKGA